MPFLIHLLSVPIGVRSFDSQVDIHSFSFVLWTGGNSCLLHFFALSATLTSSGPRQLLQSQRANNQNFSSHLSLTNFTHSKPTQF
jgi:hypothetical protein